MTKTSYARRLLRWWPLLESEVERLRAQNMSFMRVQEASTCGDELLVAWGELGRLLRELQKRLRPWEARVLESFYYRKETQEEIAWSTRRDQSRISRLLRRIAMVSEDILGESA